MGAACNSQIGSCDLDAPRVEVHDDSEATLSAVKKSLDRKLYWAGGLTFEKGSATLKPGSRQAAVALAAILRMYPSIGVKVQSYTGNQGDAKKAIELSAERARAVKAVLLENCDNVVRAMGCGYTADGGPRIEVSPFRADELAALPDNDGLPTEVKGGRQCTNGCAIQ
eukprot:UN3119